MTERELQPTFRAISAKKLGLHVLHVPGRNIDRHFRNGVRAKA